jgi:hypothetical protein
MAIFPGDRTCAGHVSGAVEIRRQHSCVPIRAGKTVIVTCLPRLEPRSFPALFALHRAGTDIGGEILQRWRSLYEAYSPSPSAPRRWVFSWPPDMRSAATGLQTRMTARSARACSDPAITGQARGAISPALRLWLPAHSPASLWPAMKQLRPAAQTAPGQPQAVEPRRRSAATCREQLGRRSADHSRALPPR